MTELIERSLFVWSTSVSFERTATRTAVFLMVASESLTATGASFAHVTTNEPVALFDVLPEASRAW